MCEVEVSDLKPVEGSHVGKPTAILVATQLRHLYPVQLYGHCAPKNG